MNLKSAIESILFSIGEPVSLNKLAKVLEQEKGIIKKAIKGLSEEYKEQKYKIK